MKKAGNDRTPSRVSIDELVSRLGIAERRYRQDRHLALGGYQGDLEDEVGGAFEIIPSIRAPLHRIVFFKFVLCYYRGRYSSFVVN